MGKAALVTLIISVLLAAQAIAPAAPIAPPPSTAAMSEFQAPAQADVSPPCVLDWSLPVTPDNQTLLVRCYKLLQAAGLIDIVNWPCPPADSDWEHIFNTYYCWRKNHPGAVLPVTPAPTMPPAGYPPIVETPPVGYP